jgi:DNA repair photolyase
MAAQVKIVQRNFEPGTSAIEALMLTAIYAQGVTAEVTILLRPCTLPNNEVSIRKEIERLGEAFAGRVFGLRKRSMVKCAFKQFQAEYPKERPVSPGL